MFENFKFMVIEDVDRDREEVLNQLADAGFLPKNLLARPMTFQSALEALSDHSQEIDVVFLDLNLPRDPADPRPEKGHGREILNIIHKTYNPRHGIRVVVVSGEDLLDGFTDQNMYDAWPGTLVSIAQKSALSKTLAASLKRLRKDPLAQRIRRAKLNDALEYYECVVDNTQPVGARLDAARKLAVLLVRNEVNHHHGSLGATNAYADKLSDLIRDHIESRFSFNPRTNRRHVDMGAIESNGGWQSFLWRGAMVQHLYVLNNYRNDHVHLPEHPYEDGTQGCWTIPRDTLDRVRGGVALGLIAEHIVRDLLDWYLPWHEQVYLPWVEGQK